VAAEVPQKKFMALILVGGGARSGKSRWALSRARQRGGRLVYIATAEALDEEMAARIVKHRAERDSAFQTIEEPLDLARSLRSADGDAIVVDCLTLWLSNRMHASLDQTLDQTEDAIAAAAAQKAEVIVVTNEVGCGIVPENALAREFRDLAGIMNQRFAEAADEVYWMVFGQPLRVK
jgi:adenosylcobinamide kinase/adenosylcobinamide-phosphate guanylyltransferase